MQVKRLIPKFSFFMILLSALVFFEACHAVPYQRTLPEWVMRVYVPMADNQSYEPALEEGITKAFIEEILLEGELDVVRRQEANTVLQIRILDYKTRASNFSSDNVINRKEAVVKLAVDMYDPSDMETRIGFVEPFDYTVSIPYERRSARRMPEVEGEALIRQRAAETLLRKVMSDMTIVGGLEAGAVE